MRTYRLVLFLMTLTASPAIAANLTNAQLMAMDFEQIQALPVEDYVMALEAKATPEDIRAILKIALRTLGYYAGELDGADNPAWRKAVTDFQSATKRTPTGMLTLAQAADLIVKQKLFVPAGLVVPQRSIIARDDGSGYFAQGSWEKRGAKELLNYTTISYYTSISCDEKNACREIEIRIEPGSYGNPDALRLLTTNWTIVETTPQRVVATGFKGRCVAARLIIDAEAQTATMNLRGSGDTGCEPDWQSMRDEISKNMGDYDLVSDMDDRMQAEADAARNAALNPAYRAALEKLRQSPAWFFVTHLDITLP